MPKWIAYAALVALGSLATASARPPAADRILPNDNRRSSGTLEHGVLTVALEARTGVWRPEGDSGRAPRRGGVRGVGQAALHTRPRHSRPAGHRDPRDRSKSAGQAAHRLRLRQGAGAAGLGHHPGERHGAAPAQGDRAGDVLLLREARGRSDWPPARRGHAAPRRHRRRPAGRAAQAGRPHLRDLLVVRGGAVEPVGIEPVHHGDQWALLAAHGAA